ncbi:MAG: integrase core domain-containing protein [Candidatus Hydrogenedentota bacterium]
MPKNTSTRPPKLCRHKNSNRAYVRINGKQIFLGPWDSPKAKRRYHEILRDWAEYGGVMPGPHTSKPAPGHTIYPYLLRNVEVERVNQVWSTDITYIPMRRGFMYLAAVIEGYKGAPDIFNTDQGAQFTSQAFTHVLLDKQIALSMDGRGRALDNVFIERLWGSLKYEEVSPKSYADGHALYKGLGAYFDYYNNERRHTALDKRTPTEVFFEAVTPK